MVILATEEYPSTRGENMTRVDFVSGYVKRQKQVIACLLPSSSLRPLENNHTHPNVSGVRTQKKNT